MSQVKKVLVAVDDTPCSLTALKYASELAGPLLAEVLVLHIDHAKARPWSRAVVMDAGQGRELWRTLNARRQEPMEELLGTLARSAKVISNARAVADVSAAILETARRHQADLLVMGTHPRTVIGQWLSPSVAEQVVRQASCPVLVVHLKDAYLRGIRARARSSQAQA